MTVFNPSREEFDNQPPAAPPPDPQVFTRVFTTPAGMPWDQARAAQLEVTHGAPLPASELMHRLRRLTPWRPGEPGRYAVFYIRLKEYQRPFEATLDVDGRPLRVAFGAVARQGATAPGISRAAMVAALCAATIGLLVAGVVFGLGARDESLARIEAAEQRVAAKSRVARAARLRTEQAELLRRQVGQARPVAEVVADLTWVAAVKAPEARIAAIHWDHGLVAVEARGETPPLSLAGGGLQRSAEPIRKGVWLWGVAPPGRGGRP